MNILKRFKLVWTVLFLILLAACSQSSSNPTDPTTPKITGKAMDIYSSSCASCHGPELQGGNAQSLVDGIWQYGDGSGYVKRNIKFGIPHLGMPSYEATLSEEEINMLVEFLYEEESRAGVVKPDPPETLESLEYTMKSEIWVDDLDIPWAIVFLNQDSALITEKPGGLRLVVKGKLVETPVSGTPIVLNEGQGGLMDVNIDRDYKKNGWIYLSYSHEIEKREGAERPPAMTRIVRGKIRDMKWVDEQVIYEAPFDSYSTTRHHYGNRIVFDRKGYLYFSIGDRGDQDQAQDPTRPNGKVHRIYPDGSVPGDNPFKDRGLSTLFTIGNRNAQGISVHPQTDDIWISEHGPLGGDELNLVRRGSNYGWPVITYGSNYNGTPVSDYTRKEGYAQPSIYWKPSIAVCGMEFYEGAEFPQWQNKLLVGALKFEEVILLDLEEDRVLHQEVIFKNYGRVRDIGLDPDGNVYVVVNRPDRVIRLSSLGERRGQ